MNNTERIKILTTALKDIASWLENIYYEKGIECEESDKLKDIREALKKAKGER